MAAEDFHDKPFNEGTLTKLQIFELYAREWFPVFLSVKRPWCNAIHVFDFFAGPGTDCVNVLGSPLRLLQQLRSYQTTEGWGKVRIYVHFYDEDEDKITQLKDNIVAHDLRFQDVTFDIQPLRFDDAFTVSARTLALQDAAKLVFIDQTGVAQVTPDVFHRLISSPTCDFLFFLSSSTLHRFHDHPAIKQKIVRPDDYYHVHRKALEESIPFLVEIAKRPPLWGARRVRQQRLLLTFGLTAGLRIGSRINDRHAVHSIL
ncbi:hypothetical protein DNFV4_04276 [Nitrospira tepida]|uniref:Three-Cys-motif partner protein TcmP n=1 Tax=Nitrospira tepida TaxID=2973512 RepID=A0AA86N386_9BACT|nr:three-Cys-motif partner protein TcmP [Nitrospira tepida]CAI4033834.1 hypothetical protein DNFV4_04276 [Nitrospira tepida]